MTFPEPTNNRFWNKFFVGYVIAHILAIPFGLGLLVGALVY